MTEVSSKTETSEVVETDLQGHLIDIDLRMKNNSDEETTEEEELRNVRKSDNSLLKHV